jgi:hypothetical protein
VKRATTAWVSGLAIFGVVLFLSVTAALNRVGEHGGFDTKEDAVVSALLVALVGGGTVAALVGSILWLRDE